MGRFWTDAEILIVDTCYEKIGPQKTTQLLHRAGSTKTKRAVIQKASKLRAAQGIAKRIVKRAFEEQLAELPTQSLFSVLRGFVTCLQYDIWDTHIDNALKIMLYQECERMITTIAHAQTRFIKEPAQQHAKI